MVPDENASFALLVVDDVEDNREILSARLAQLGYANVATASGGREALAMIERTPFDLVLLDLMMPGMSGIDVLERLRSAGQLAALPVIMVSAASETDSVVRCIELGAEDYLTKPVNPILLKARIGASLEKKRLRDRQKELVRRFATPEVAQDLQQSGFALGGKRVDASVMFCDIRNFTPLVDAQSPEDTIELLNAYYTLMFDAISRHGGIVNLIIGDGLMAIFGAPVPLPSHSDRAVRAALEMCEMLELFNIERTAAQKPAIRIGIGIASGEMVAGYTGTNERATYTCIGDTVILAARLEAHTKMAGHPVLIDAATREALRNDIRVEALGAVPIRGKTQSVETFAVVLDRSE